MSKLSDIEFRFLTKQTKKHGVIIHEERVLQYRKIHDTTSEYYYSMWEDVAEEVEVENVYPR